MRKVALAVLVTLVIFFVVPFPFYGALSAITGMEPPGGSPALFMLTVLIQKTGHAIGFVLLFYLGRAALHGRWLTYATVWWVVFALDETGLALGPEYSWGEAVAGILAEAVYFTLAGFVTNRLVGGPAGVRSQESGITS